MAKIKTKVWLNIKWKYSHLYAMTFSPHKIIFRQNDRIFWFKKFQVTRHFM